MIARKFLLSIFALLTITFVGCKDEDPEFYALNVVSRDIAEGDIYQFYVEGYTGAISWKVDSESVATIDQTGKVKGVKIGTTAVRALLANGTKLMAQLNVIGRAGAQESGSVSVSLEQIMMSANSTVEFGVDVAKSLIDTEKYPLHVEIAMVAALQSDNEAETPTLPEASTVLREDSTGYDVTITAGTAKGEFLCSIVLGDFEQEIPLIVDYGVYLSHNNFEPGDYSNVGTVTTKQFPVGSSQSFPIFCYVDGGNYQQKQALKDALKNKDNYTSESITIEIDVENIVIDDSKDIWNVTLPIKSNATGYEQGTLTFTYMDKTLLYNMIVDDGKHFDELYVSFESIYTYSEETKLTSRLMKKDYMMYVGGNVDPDAAPERFKVLVYYTMAPDDRGDFIEWSVKTPLGDSAPVKLIGYQKINTQQFEFEFEVNAAGEVPVELSIQNPKADQPGLTEEEKALYETYRTQTLVANMLVIDRKDVVVESVEFQDGSDPSVAQSIEVVETTAGTYPLYTYITPEESTGAWPALFEIVEYSDEAEATVKQGGIDPITGDEIIPEISIKHAGTIKVKATAKDKTDELTIIAKFQIPASATPLQLGTATQKQEYEPGETDLITYNLMSNYSVRADEFTWTSSDENVVKVDEYGNLAMVADGEAVITASITDDFGKTVSATRSIKVYTPKADFNYDDPVYADFYVIELTGEEGIYYIDTEEGSELLQTMELDAVLSSMGDGTYTAGVDFNGTLDTPDGFFDIVGGTITISGDTWTFDLNILNDKLSGKVIGSKDYVLF